jgi:hypothetical protein
MIAEDGSIGVFLSTGRMRKARTEVVKVSDWLKADAMVRIDLANLVRYNIVGRLQINQLR